MKNPQSAPKHSKESRPIRCLVIQLARLGDTVQSLMALRAAKQLYPELEITLLTRETFADAAQRVDWITKVETLSTRDLIGKALSASAPVEELLPNMAQWLAPLVKKHWDMVINWTYTDASSYLTALIPAQVKLGYHRNNDLTLRAVDGWSQYVQGIVQESLPQNIHLTDILTTQLLTALQIHYGEPDPSSSNSPVTSKHFFKIRESASLSNGRFDYARRWVAVQLGAGAENKIWPTRHWIQFLKKVLNENPQVHLVLMGGKDDVPRAREIQAGLVEDSAPTDRILSIVGEADFDLWTHSIARSEWLISGDTAAIHLASVLGTRVFNLSVGPVRYWETGPYGNGHYVARSTLSCTACSDQSDTHSCGESLDPDAVFAAFHYVSSNWHQRRTQTLGDTFSKLGLDSLRGRVRLLKSRIRASEEGGGVTYDDVESRQISASDWTAVVTGHIARAWYCGWTPPIGAEFNRKQMGQEVIKFLRQLRESLTIADQILNQSIATGKRVEAIGKSLKSTRIMSLDDRRRLNENAQKLLDLDALVERLAKTEPSLKFLVTMRQVLLHNLSERHLSDMSRETIAKYQQLKEAVTFMNDWASHSLRLTRPVVVGSKGDLLGEIPNQRQ